MNALDKEIESRFLQELGEIALNFIKAFGLKFEQQVENLNDPLLRWVDFRLRYIDPAPRRIVLSKQFPRRLPRDIASKLNRMATRISRGENINQFQGAGLVLHHDTSGKKKQLRTDLLWADWGISHLHLSDENGTSKGKTFSARADWLLFVLITKNECAFIDIKHHQKPYVFSSQSLIETVAKSWPEWIEQYQLKGILPGTQRYTPEELHQLRRSGLSPLTTIGNKVYMGPGMGITSAATSLHAGTKSDRVFECVTYLAQMICDPDDQFQKFACASKIVNPEFHLCITPKGLAVFEEKSDMAWLLPRAKLDTKENFLEELHNLLAPEWAITHLLENTNALPCT